MNSTGSAISESRRGMKPNDRETRKSTAMTTLADIRKRADDLRAQGWVDRKGTEMLLHDLIVSLHESEQDRLEQRNGAVTVERRIGLRP